MALGSAAIFSAGLFGAKMWGELVLEKGHSQIIVAHGHSDLDPGSQTKTHLQAFLSSTNPQQRASRQFPEKRAIAGQRWFRFPGSYSRN